MMSTKIPIVCVVAVFTNLVTGLTPIDLIHRQNVSNGKTNKIIGGTLALPHEFPYQVAVISSGGGLSSSFCGGSLISTKAVLTNAHCIIEYTASDVILGTNNALDENSDGYVEISATERIVHPNFTPDPLDYDIALLILAVEAPVGDTIKPILLPRLGTNENNLVGRRGLIAGWGTTSDDPSAFLTSNLVWVEVPIVDNQQCADFFGSTYINSRHVCVGTEGGTVGPCLGDHGGAVAVYDELYGETVQVGIFSIHETLGCTKSSPAVSAKIDRELLKWIGENGGPPVRNAFYVKS